MSLNENYRLHKAVSAVVHQIQTYFFYQLPYPNLLFLCAGSFWITSCLSPWQQGKGCDKQEYHHHIHSKLIHYYFHPFLKKLSLSSSYYRVRNTIIYIFKKKKERNNNNNTRSPVGTRKAVLSWIIANRQVYVRHLLSDVCLLMDVRQVESDFPFRHHRFVI